MLPIILGLTGVMLLGAGATMAVRGVDGRRTISQELSSQRICFPEGDRLPSRFARYAGTRVRTGEQARAYSDLIATHVARATGGRTYAEIADEWMASGGKDEQLVRMRETAFMGQTLRGALLGAYQAWQITLLVIGLGALFGVLGAALMVMAWQV